MGSSTYQDNEFPLIRILVVERAVRNTDVHGRATGGQHRLHGESTGYIFQSQREHRVQALEGKAHLDFILSPARAANGMGSLLRGKGRGARCKHICRESI